MSPDPLLINLRHTVTIGERLRADLEGVSTRASAAERGGARIEMVMFYGQAFDEIHRPLNRRVEHGSMASRVLHEAVCGMALHRGWMLSTTRIDAPEQLGRMAEHWGRIVEWVLDDGDRHG